jgi:hypothetical protein
MSLDELQLENLILRIGEGAHGNAGILELKNALKKAKPNEIISFWQKQGIREPITWDAVKERLWKVPEEQEKNRFPFLQGDIILTSGVSRLAQSRSTMTHSIWLFVRRRVISFVAVSYVLLHFTRCCWIIATRPRRIIRYIYRSKLPYSFRRIRDLPCHQ